MQSFLLNTEKFDEIIEKFKKFVADKNQDDSVSFNDGWLDQQEGYKRKIPEGAYESLETLKWDKKWIGTGKIITHVIAALKYNPPDNRNNLVDWRRWRNLNKIMSANLEKTKTIESLIYRLYSEENTDDELFAKLVDDEAIGKKYDLISYLFFLKNSIRYLPNRPDNFEVAFSLLGGSFVFRMSGKCSWTNYSEFLNRISEIRELLAPKFDDEISLIDAHSFCWVIAHFPEILDIDLNSGISKDAQLVLTDPPFVSTDENLKPKKPRQFKAVTKKERERNERRNNQIGDVGEVYVRDAEKRFLIENGRSDLAEAVYHASKAEGDGFGYDIKSFTLDDQVKYIEVKTTTSDKNTKFFISDNELEFSRLNSDNYYLYRLYNFNNLAEKNPYYVIEGNLEEKLFLSPYQFYALPRNKKEEN